MWCNTEEIETFATRRLNWKQTRTNEPRLSQISGSDAISYRFDKVLKTQSVENTSREICSTEASRKHNDCKHITERVAFPYIWIKPPTIKSTSPVFFNEIESCWPAGKWIFINLTWKYFSSLLDKTFAWITIFRRFNIRWNGANAFRSLLSPEIFPSRFLGRAVHAERGIYHGGIPFVGASTYRRAYCLPRPICVRVFGAREGAFVYPKLDFEASVIEFQVRLRGQLLIRLRPIWEDIPCFQIIALNDNSISIVTIFLLFFFNSLRIYFTPDLIFLEV